MKNALVLAVLVAGLALAHESRAQTLYKLVHPNGKVEYAEKPPKDFPGKVIRIDVNPDANTATLPKYQAGGAGNSEGKGAAIDVARRDIRIQAARERVDVARKALKNAQDNPADDEVTRVGNAGGGTRPVPSDAYQERIKGLEKAVKDAEDALRAAEDKG